VVHEGAGSTGLAEGFSSDMTRKSPRGVTIDVLGKDRHPVVVCQWVDIHVRGGDSYHCTALISDVPGGRGYPMGPLPVPSTYVLRFTRMKTGGIHATVRSQS